MPYKNLNTKNQEKEGTNYEIKRFKKFKYSRKNCSFRN